MKQTPFFDKTKHKIQIIAPSSPLSSKEEHDKLMEKALQLFNERAIQVEVNPEIGNKVELPWYANSVEFRGADLKKALLDPDVRIIWTLRGGSSAAEVAELIDTKPTSPKVLIGFSDITVLHTLFNQKFNLPSIHGETINRIVNYNKIDSLEEILDMISNNNRLEYKLKPLNSNDTDGLSGKLLGGNLKVLTTLIGTDLHPNFDDSILIIEEVNEKGYSVMRDLVHLRQAKLLESVKAIIFGDFIGGNEVDGKNYVEDTINYFAQHIDIPCFKIEGFGHGAVNHPVILGADCLIEDSNLKISNPFNQ